jgi:uncharacterized membrane protein
MIERFAHPSSAAGVDLRLRPNRSATARGLVAVFGAMVVLGLAVAGFAASQGNWFAPLFAVLEMTAVAYCLLLAFRSASREQHIVLSPRSVEVSGAGAEARFDPFWVRVVREPGRTANEPERVLLRSHGRSVEVGAFLNADERAALVRKLDAALAAVRRAEPDSKDR